MKTKGLFRISGETTVTLRAIYIIEELIVNSDSNSIIFVFFFIFYLFFNILIINFSKIKYKKRFHN